MEMQHTEGKGTFPGTPLNSGVAPCFWNRRSTTASISAVVTPGSTMPRIRPCAWATSRPASRIARAPLRLQQPSIVSHDQMTVDFLHEVESHGDDDQQARAPEEAGN